MSWLDKIEQALQPVTNFVKDGVTVAKFEIADVTGNQAAMEKLADKTISATTNLTATIKPIDDVRKGLQEKAGNFAKDVGTVAQFEYADVTGNQAAMEKLADKTIAASSKLENSVNHVQDTIVGAARDAKTITQFEYADLTGDKATAEKLSAETINAADRSEKRTVAVATSLPGGDLITSAVTAAGDKVGLTTGNYDRVTELGGNKAAAAVGDIAHGKFSGKDGMALFNTALAFVPGGGTVAGAAVKDVVVHEAVSVTENVVATEVAAVTQNAVTTEVAAVAQSAVTTEVAAVAEKKAEETVIGTVRNITTDATKDLAKETAKEPVKDSVKEEYAKSTSENQKGADNKPSELAMKDRGPSNPVEQKPNANSHFAALLAKDTAKYGKGYTVGTEVAAASDLTHKQPTMIAAAAPAPAVGAGRMA